MTETAPDHGGLLRRFIALAGEAMALTDEAGRLIEWNGPLEALTGLARAAVLGRPLWEAQWEWLPPAERTPEQMQRLRLHQEVLLASGASLDPDQEAVSAVHQPGGSRLVATTITPVPAEGGRCLVLSLRPFSNAPDAPDPDLAARAERRRVEAALAAGERKLHGLVEHATDGILLADEQGLIIAWNPAEERLTGLPREAALGRPVWDVLHELLPPAERTVENRGRIREYLRHAVTTGELRGTAGLTERHYVMPDGGERWLHSLNFTIPTGQGHVLGRISRDITDRKRAEAELLQRNRQLEILSETSQQINAVLDPPVVLRTLVLAAMDALGAEGGAAGLMQAGRLVFSEARLDGQARPVEWAFARGEGPAGAAWRTLQPYLSADAAADPLISAEQRQALELRNLVSVPLVGRAGQVLGCLEVYNAPGPQPFGPAALGLLRGLAAGAATALENAHLLSERERAYERTEQSLRRLTALRAVDSAINASPSLSVTLSVLLEQGLDGLGLEAGVVLVAHPTRQVLEFAASRGFEQPGVERRPLRYGECLAGRAVLERRLVHAADLAGDDLSLRPGARLDEMGFAAYYAAPLLAKGTVKGVLEVFGRAPHAPDPDWSEFLEALAAQAALAIDGARLFNDLQRANFDLSLAYDATIEGWARALDLRERQPAGQGQRLAQNAERLGRAMGLTPADLVALRRGALLHDIGLMALPDHILHKPGPLSGEEWEVIRQHPDHAHDLLAPIAFLRAALDVPYAHHERWDGSGYPRGLKGDEIPVLARIFAVADVWDALRASRPHRPPWPGDRARAYLAEQAGRLFDPRVVEAFLPLV